MTDIDILSDIAYYDGYDEVLRAIADDMEDFLKNRVSEYTYKTYFLNEVNEHVTHIEWDSELMVFWEYLVLKFGDYGTSPRSGYIEKIEECIKFIRENFKEHDVYA